jgi:hypothetical protein
MRVVRLSSALATCFLMLGSSGCAAQLAERNQLAAELVQARDEAAAERARVTELETRLLVIEKDLATSKRAQANHDAPVLAKLDRLIRVNEKLLQRTPEPAPAVIATASVPLQSTMSSSESPATDDSCAEGLAPAEQIERLVRRLHGGHSASWRGGLSLEQSQALRVLLRRERELDANSPWQVW